MIAVRLAFLIDISLSLRGMPCDEPLPLGQDETSKRQEVENILRQVRVTIDMRTLHTCLRYIYHLTSPCQPRSRNTRHQWNISDR